MLIRVAIDGPSGSGKSTVSKMVARNFGFVYIDTGAMYRACAYIYLNYKLDNDSFMEKINRSSFNFMKKGEKQLLVVKDNDDELTLSDNIRTPEVTSVVSKISAMSGIRSILKIKQQKIAKSINCVMEGRDIGSIIIPDAEVKIFLVATVEVRAHRRYKEWKEKKIDASYKKVLEDIERRDNYDMNRKIAPLKKTESMLLVDSTDSTIEEVVLTISEIINAKLKNNENICS